MSEQPKKRGLFQVHLSTCVVVMFVAGGLLWANALKLELELEYKTPSFFGLRSFTERERRIAYGWPRTFLTRNPQFKAEDLSTLDRVELLELARQWNYANLALNVSVALVILATAAVVLEWFLRRQERRR
ncbi:MAG TPA: hypothetical protein VGP72_21515 [Planctomycetota bacterium]|jgi:hypothetical protein